MLIIQKNSNIPKFFISIKLFFFVRINNFLTYFILDIVIIVIYLFNNFFFNLNEYKKIILRNNKNYTLRIKNFKEKLLIK